MNALLISDEAWADLGAVRAKLEQANLLRNGQRRRMVGEAKDEFARLKRNVKRLEAELIEVCGEGRQE